MQLNKAESVPSWCSDILQQILFPYEPLLGLGEVRAFLKPGLGLLWPQLHRPALTCWDCSPGHHPQICAFENVTTLGFWFGLVFCFLVFYFLVFETRALS